VIWQLFFVYRDVSTQKKLGVAQIAEKISKSAPKNRADQYKSSFPNLPHFPQNRGENTIPVLFFGIFWTKVPYIRLFFIYFSYKHFRLFKPLYGGFAVGGYHGSRLAKRRIIRLCMHVFPCQFG